jgi:hypothetical protein
VLCLRLGNKRKRQGQHHVSAASRRQSDRPRLETVLRPHVLSCVSRPGRLEARNTLTEEIRCLAEYIEHSMDAVSESPDSKCFPLRCPECGPHGRYRTLREEVIDAVLEPASFVRLHELREEEKLPRLWCPAPTCGKMVVARDAGAAQHFCAEATCRAEVCIRCKVLAHHGLTCQQYQVSLVLGGRPTDIVHRCARLRHSR